MVASTQSKSTGATATGTGVLPVYPGGMWRMKVRVIPANMIVCVVSPCLLKPNDVLTWLSLARK
ncbi:MAG: hypothetical protein ABUL77_05220 [Bacteroidota bacterium]